MAKPIVASIGFDWFSAGPQAALFRSRRILVGRGSGDRAARQRPIVVSQLRIVENLGKDPVADKILYNLIEFATNR